MRGELLLRLGRAEIAAGKGRRAAVHLEEAYGCTRDPVARGRAVELLSQSLLGDLEHMRRWRELATAVLGELEPRDPGLALRLKAILLLGDPGAVALELTGATPDEAVYLAHLVLRSMSPAARAADIADLALRAARHADALLEEGGYALAFASTVLALRWTDHVEAAGALLERAIGSARRRGANADFAIAMTHRAVLARGTGRLRDAEADARAALAVELDAERGGFAQGVIPLLGTLLDQGRIDDARAELARGVGDQLPVEAPAMTALILSRMAVLAACGDHAGALRDWDEALRRTRRTHAVNASWMDDLEVAVDVCASLGDHERAAEIAALAQHLADAWNTPRAFGLARLAQARIAASDVERVEVLRDAVDSLARGPARFQEARARVALGAALRRLGQRVESRTPLREGYELARRCGSDGLAELARAELRASGIRLQRALVTGADALTPSERRIADMAAEGLANPEIAQALFLTVKTVEMHLTHAYRKLDIRGRSELPAALATQA